MHRLLPVHLTDALFHTGFVGLDNNRAVCDFGIKEFNHELVLQPVEELNVPHSRAVIGEYMGDLYTNMLCGLCI